MKYTNIALNIIAALLFAGAGLIAYWAIIPVDVIKHYTFSEDEGFVQQTEQPYSFETVKDTVKRGEIIELVFYFQKVHQVSAETTRSLICGDDLITLTPFTSDLDTSDEIESIIGRVEIPLKTSPGECYLTYTTTRQLNPLRVYTERFESNVFMVK